MMERTKEVLQQRELEEVEVPRRVSNCNCNYAQRYQDWRRGSNTKLTVLDSQE